MLVHTLDSRLNTLFCRQRLNEKDSVTDFKDVIAWHGSNLAERRNDLTQSFSCFSKLEMPWCEIMQIEYVLSNRRRSNTEGIRWCVTSMYICIHTFQQTVYYASYCYIQ